MRRTATYRAVKANEVAPESDRVKDRAQSSDGESDGADCTERGREMGRNVRVW